MTPDDLDAFSDCECLAPRGERCTVDVLTAGLMFLVGMMVGAAVVAVLG